MYIKKLEIRSFGPLINKTVEFKPGLNIIEGKNESGKSTIAMFIKFMFYGLSGKPSAGTNISERDLYINWDTGVAAGSLTLICKEEKYKIERRLTKSEELSGKETYHESTKITNLTTGDTVRNIKSAGEYFFVFPEKVYVQSAFVKNIDTAKIDGSGLKVALENLLTSGDEEINTKKALEKLDGARKLLLHKNGVGGKIAELTCEKRDLDEMLEKSKDASSEIVSLEGTLSDLEVKVARREAQYTEYQALCRAYEAVRIGSRVKEIERCEGSIKFLQSEIESLNPEVNPQTLVKIELCEAAVKDIEADIQTLSEKRAELEAKCEGRDLEEPSESEDIIKKAGALKGKRTFFLAISCTLCAVALFTAIVFLGFGEMIKSMYSPFFIPLIVLAAVFLAAGTGGFFLYRLFDKKWTGFLEKWNVEDIYALENAVLAKKEKYKYTKKLIDNIKSIDETMERAVERHDKEIDNGFSLGDICGIARSDNVFDVLNAAKHAAEEICSGRDAMTVKLESAKGRLSALLEEISEEERECAEKTENEALENLDREKVLSMTKEDYARAVKERDFADTTAKAMRRRESDIKSRLSALKAAGKSPAEIAGRISLLEKEIKDLTFKHKALVTAYSALMSAGEKMRGDVMPHVVELAAGFMGLVTCGKYESLSAGENFDLSFISNDEKRSVEYLSEGTKDAAYVCVRAALVNVMYKENAPAMIFDECFARMDKDRLYGVLRSLANMDTAQSIVFTCRDLEGKTAPEANIITL